jgi:hypothetical protein
MMTIIQKGTYQGSYNIGIKESINYEVEIINKDEGSIHKTTLSQMQSYYNIFDKTYQYVVSDEEPIVNTSELYGQEATMEHMAKLFISKKEDIDNLTQELIHTIESNINILIDYEKNYTDCHIEFAQCNLLDGYSILHFMSQDSDVIQKYEKLMSPQILNNIMFCLQPDDLFNSYYNYGDKWFMKHTNNDIVLAYYKTYVHNPKIMDSLKEDCMPFIKKARKLLEKEKIIKEKDFLDNSLAETSIKTQIKL